MRNISSRFSGNSEPDASELLDLEEMLLRYYMEGDHNTNVQSHTCYPSQSGYKTVCHVTLCYVICLPSFCCILTL